MPEGIIVSTTPLNALRVFEAVARTGSFRAAADILCVTQSAVSHQIRHLEAWMQAPLFARDGNRTRLLPHGAELARVLSLSFDQIDAACARARTSGGRQPLVIACIPSVAMCWLIPRLADFRARRPEIEIRVIYAMHGHEIDFRETHVAFVYAATPPDHPGVESLPFLPGASVPVCSPSLVLRKTSSPVEPAQMVRLGLLHDTDTSGWRSWLGKAGHRPAGPLDGAVFEDFNLLRSAALSGQGVALCPNAMIGADITAGSLVRLSDIPVLTDHGYFMLIGSQTEGAMRENVSAFRDWAMASRDD